MALSLVLGFCRQNQNGKDQRELNLDIHISFFLPSEENDL
jgi:hypothetical protein